MSQGDTLFGKKTFYKEIEMRSRFETKIAYFLDCLNIKWKYEPKTFLLSSGIMYCPDFFLPELNMWIEAKGVIEPHNKEISRCFVENNHTELLLIAPRETLWFSMKDFRDFSGENSIEALSEDNMIWISKCHSCDSWFFCCNMGSYHCRKCQVHDGDHGIRGDLGEIKDFSDLDSIKEGLKGYGISI